MIKLGLVDIFSKNIEELISYNYQVNIAIAVSGGSDSIALLLLLDEWLKIKKFDVTLNVLTVNHNLRPTSNNECLYVSQLAHKLGHNCQILNWFPKLPLNNLQATARKARYNLMTDYCLDHNIMTLLVGQHQDDYIENFIIRNNRKSGEFGLSSTNIHFYNNIKIVRPLYNIKKNILVNYLQNKNIAWVEDESNYNEKYTRVKIRKYLSVTSVEVKQDNLNHQNQIDKQLLNLKPILISSLAESCVITKYGFTVVDIKLFNNYSYVIKLQILSYILTITGGKDHGPRARSMDLLIKLSEEDKNFINTLHGCTIKKLNDKIIIWRSFGKTIPEDVIARQNSMWDNRFIVKSTVDFDGLIISNLDMKTYQEIRKKLDLTRLSNLSFKSHKKILFTLPVIKKLEKLLAIPHISFYGDDNLRDRIKLSYHPKFISRFIHFA